MAEVNLVTMSDGRQVDFGSRKMLKSYAVQDGKVTARFDFLHGQTINFELPPALVFQAAGHGVVQKAGDSAALGNDPQTGKPATSEDMAEAVQDTLDSLSKGNWKVTREGGGGFAGTGVVVRALCAVFNKTPEQIKAWVDSKIAEAEERKVKLTRQALYASFRSSDKVGPKIRELEAAAAKSVAGVDAEAILGELA